VLAAAVFAASCWVAAPLRGEEGSRPEGALTARAALAAALLGSPDLAVFAAEMRAREARILQAGLLPNPELRLDVEDIAGSGRRSGFDSSQTTLRLSQLIELGGKRPRRVDVAAADRDLAGLEYETRRRQVVNEVSRAFVAVLAAQAEVGFATELETIAAESVAAFEKQVAAGAAPAVEVARAQVFAGRARVERLRTERELAVARTMLAATWGESVASFSSAAGDLSEEAHLPGRETLLEQLQDNPELRRWTAEVHAREAALALAEAGAIPSIAVGAGGRSFGDNGDHAMVIELTVPMPVFQRNQGMIAEAQERVAKARAERHAVEVALRAALLSSWERFQAATERVRILHGHVVPEAEASLAGAREAYRRGLYRSLDVLDAQRTLFEVRLDQVRAQAARNVAVADIERLAGSGKHSEGEIR
jgi:cobalt-zinc-cadmium efflux system outer membrane protein